MVTVTFEHDAIYRRHPGASRREHSSGHLHGVVHASFLPHQSLSMVLSTLGCVVHAGLYTTQRGAGTLKLSQTHKRKIHFFPLVNKLFQKSKKESTN